MSALKQERRQTRRLIARVHVAYGRRGESLIPAKTVDVSPTGVFIGTSRHYPLGTLIELSFSGPPFDSPIGVNAKVTRCETSPGREGMAVKFNEWQGGPEMRARFFDAMKQEARHPSAEQPTVAAPTDSLFRTAACQACGWTGKASKFVKKCPQCGSGI
jgi:hypothetical protein